MNPTYLALGLVLGIAMDNIALGIAFGFLFSVCFVNDDEDDD